MSEQVPISAEIWLGHFALVADHLGQFSFVTLPRVDELIVIPGEDERQILRVKSITHHAQPITKTQASPIVRLLCTKE